MTIQRSNADVRTFVHKLASDRIKAGRAPMSVDEIIVWTLWAKSSIIEGPYTVDEIKQIMPDAFLD